MPDCNIEVRETLPLLLRPMPWNWTSRIARRTQNHVFETYLTSADPTNTICYFWPDTPIELVMRAKDLGIMTVREMINTYRGKAKEILDLAYAQLGLKATHNITDASVELERRELLLYDYIFACSQVVAKSLVEAGVAAERILPTGFGFTPVARPIERNCSDSNSPTVLFVGTAGVRKGLPLLLEAWAKASISGQLLVAGKIEDVLRPTVDRYRLDYNVKFLDFVSDISALYAIADFIVLPTFEEGAPLVIYEAAAAGLPVITTPMGAADVVKDGINGLIVNAGEVDALANAIARLASSRQMRTEFSRQIASDAAELTYSKVGQRRVEKLTNLLTAHRLRF